VGSRAPRALVVDDDDFVRAGVTEVLRDNGWVVHAAPDGCEIEQLLARVSPDVAVLDVRLAVGPNGYEMARRIRANSDVPILFLTGADEEHERLAGFEAGGDDYLLKPFLTSELVARLGALLRRSGFTAAQASSVADITIDTATRTVTRAGSIIHLSATELGLLITLSEHPGRVFSKPELLRRVWDYEEGNPNMVEVQVSSLRHKLEKHGPRLIHTVRGRGYAFRP
jgi:DNA-binding response OmpR family regulator